MKLSKLRPCDGCGEGLGATFFRLEVEHHVVNLTEARKRVAMELMFPGAAGLAAVMSGDPEDGTQVAQSHTVLLCPGCFAEGGSVPRPWQEGMDV